MANPQAMKRPRSLAIMNHIQTAAMLVVAAAMLWLVWLIVQSQREPSPLQYTNTPFPVIQPVHAGDVIEIIVQKCNVTDITITYVVTRELIRIDDQVHFPVGGLSGIQTSKPGCGTDINRLSIIPSDLPPGRYQLEGIARVEGKLRMTHSVVWESEVFEVIR